MAPNLNFSSQTSDSPPDARKEVLTLYMVTSICKSDPEPTLRLVSEAAGAVVHPPKLEARICRDSNDDNVLACSLAAETDYLVTGDADLLNLRSFRNTLIISPRDFESLFVD